VQVAGKVWVVTGGGNGIGRELVLLLLRRGALVAAVDVNEDALLQTAQAATADARLSIHRVDITDKEAVRSLVNEVRARHGAVDGLINNAGVIQSFVAFQELTDEEISRVLNINLMGTVYMVQAFLPELLNRPQAYIANVSSMGGFFPFPNQTMYGASKAAVKLLTEGLFAELQGTSVGVSVVMPGPTRTNISAGVAGAPEQSTDSRIPMTEPDAAARMILEGIEKDQLHIYLGPIARFANLAIRIAPRQAILFVRAQMQKMMMETTPAHGVPRRG